MSHRSSRLIEPLELRQLLTIFPDGFSETFITRLPTTIATSMEFAPDGRLFITDSARGQVRIFQNGKFTTDPFLTVDVDHYRERGLESIAFDPNFATNGYVYIYYTKADPANRDTAPNGAKNRLSRFTANPANPNVALAGSEKIILDNIDSDTGIHNGGAMHFGADGMMYLGIGDAGDRTNAQDLSTLNGKILRLNVSDLNNLVPADNPFVNTPGARGEIWARGFRNPYTGNIKPGTNTLYINDVGEVTWEEVNNVVKGGNYGWPIVEGSSTNTAYINPIAQYNHNGKSAAITGGVFYTGNMFPAEYKNRYFFSDYLQKITRTVNPNNNNAVATFATSTISINDFDERPDGSLWYLEIGGNVYRITYAAHTNRGPTAVAKSDKTSGLAPLVVNFDGSASTDPDGDPLTYLWNYGDGQTGSGAKPSHTYTINGKYNVTLTVTDSHGATSAAGPIVITVGNTAPVPRITLPTNGSLYSAGQTINFAGSATDTQDGNIPATSLTWSFVFHHQTHTHPFLPDKTGITSASFTIPTTGEVDPNQFYRIRLTAKDSAGLTGSTFVDVKPRTSVFTLATNIAGLSLTLDGTPFVAPKATTGVVNHTRTIGAPLSQTVNGKTYQFVSWSDGKSATHAIATPATNTTYTATYKQVTGTTLGAIADSYVRDGTQYQNTNFGSSGELQVKQSSTGYNRISYLKFDLSSVSTITSAKLRLWGRLSGAGAGVGIRAYGVADQTWTESGLTWANRKPAGSTIIGSATVSSTTGAWYEIDLTAYLKAQKAAGKNIVTIALRASTSSNPYVIFSSRNATTNRPQLLIT